MADTTVRAQLEGTPRHVSYGRDDLRQAPALGLLSRVENLAADLGPRAEQAERRARVGLAFEHTGRLQSLRRRLGRRGRERCYLTAKGARVVVTGRLDERSWET
jgi:hypothetical protein